MITKGREITNAIVVSATAYFALFAFHHYILSGFDITSRTAVFFVPAAARVFCTLIFGYWAGLGIAIGTLLNSLIATDNLENWYYLAMLAISVGSGCSLSLMFWALVSRRVSGVLSPQIDYFSITWRDILGFSVIQALLNSSFTHMLFYLFPDYQLDVSIYLLAVMFVGDLSGAFLIFVASNIGYSFWLRARKMLV